MIIEFQDRLKRRVIIDTANIGTIIENIEHTTSGNDYRLTGTWDVTLFNELVVEVDRETKEFIVDKWEGVTE
jgi:hypothetical protein